MSMARGREGKTKENTENTADSVKKTFENTGTKVAGSVDRVKDSIASKRQAGDDLLARAQGPVTDLTSKTDQARSSFDSAFARLNGPADALSMRQQQAQAAIDSATLKAESAGQVLSIREKAHSMSLTQLDQGVGNAKGMADQVTQGIEQRQTEFNTTTGMITSLKERIAAQVQGAGQLNRQG
jgi:hypothetical protein